jgi:hypothetical protein
MVISPLFRLTRILFTEMNMSKKIGFSEIEDGIRASMTSETYRVLLEHEAN